MAEQQSTFSKPSSFAEEFDQGFDERLNRYLDHWEESCRQREAERAMAVPGEETVKPLNDRLDQIEVNSERRHSEIMEKLDELHALIANQQS
jgi:hypothetical protein